MNAFHLLLLTVIAEPARCFLNVVSRKGRIRLEFDQRWTTFLGRSSYTEKQEHLDSTNDLHAKIIKAEKKQKEAKLRKENKSKSAYDEIPSVKRKKRKLSEVPLYTAEFDNVITLPFPVSDESLDGTPLLGLAFTINGKPVPLSRHRTGLGLIYNPSSYKQEEFRQAVREILCSPKVGLDQYVADPQKNKKAKKLEDTVRPGPVFSLEKKISLKIIFRMPRPNAHFVGNKRSPDRLRTTAPKWMIDSKRAADVDNLAKFVLDSFNGIMYEDDHQVVALSVIKVIDNHGYCTGGTDILIQQVESDSHISSAARSLKDFD